MNHSSRLIRYIVLGLIAGLGFLQFSSALAQQPALQTFSLRWQKVRELRVTDNQSAFILTFEGATEIAGQGGLPGWATRISHPGQGLKLSGLAISDEIFLPLTPAEMKAVDDVTRIPETVIPQISFASSAGYSDVTLFPFRKNIRTGNIEKLLSFSLSYSFEPSAEIVQTRKSASWIAHSALAAGNWYKFSVSSEGIQIITYDDLVNDGVDVSSVDPRNIRIYGNGGGMLPESNSAVRTEDLLENAIYVHGEEDGSFGPGDYILFFGASPDQWIYNTQAMLFNHRKNIYADETCYFLTFGLGPGKRISTDPGTSSAPTNYISRFNDFAFYEMDTKNLIGTGREWYDEQIFESTLTRSYPFLFPNIDVSYPAVITASVAAHSVGISSSFTVSAADDDLMNINLSSVSSNYLAPWASKNSGSGSFTPASPSLEIQLAYNRYVTSAIGYLNYLEINVMRDLVMTGNQMKFRSVLSQGTGKTAEFRLTTQGQSLTVWDVTEPGEAMVVLSTTADNLLTFRVETEDLREFIAFDGTSFYSPAFRGKVANQDLHGEGGYDYVIVTHADFLGQANDLAEFHRTVTGFSVLVATTDQVYNEFSSGVQDISAIRDFMKLMYDKSGGESPQHLLLFGDASYDYKDRIENNLNLVPSYESAESLDPTYSYVTDDYYALLEAGEGSTTGGVLAGTLDIGVGRLPVQTVEEATAAVRKIRHYSSVSDSVMNNWRNILCFVADDEDGNLHMEQVEMLTSSIAQEHPVYNIDKIYVDAYQQTATPVGQRVPEVNDAINKRVQGGSLIVSYTGHGGEIGWGHEQFLEVADIKSWNNFNSMPVFVTATCEFSRFDDPKRVSAGEMVFLNADGGGIALFTTARPTFASTNLELASSFFNVAFEKQDGAYMKMGDLIRMAKNNLTSSSNTRKFVLLGDPGLTMAYPRMNVVTTSINGDTASSSDTLRALSLMEITGEIRDEAGQLASGFSGEVFPTVFDKPVQIQTFGDNGNDVMTFQVQKNQVYSGKVDVENGQFSFRFIVPKDIAYNFGNGKISYYARNGEIDANGYDNSIVVGGFNPDPAIDEEGPEISLYMNDRNFTDGSMTGPNPVLLADVRDISGINTVGNGIGHDITAILDGETDNPMILNDYYVADLNTYQSGVITYPLYNLAEGEHELSLKVWDVYNNSSEAVIRFVVYGEGSYYVSHLYNYPNPFKTSTTFSFESNRADSELHVDLRIFSMYGRLVRSMSEDLYVTGFRTEPMIWDGTDEGGAKCAAGLYVYHMTAILPDGTANHASGKLVLIKD